MSKQQSGATGRNNRFQIHFRISSMLAAAVVVGAALWGAGIFNLEWPAISAGEKKAQQSVTPEPRPMSATTSVANSISQPGQKKLRLVSTSPGRNATEGTAQISVGAADVLTFGAGAILAGGAILQEIYTDHVVLRRGDASASLYVEGLASNPRSAQVLEGDESVLLADESGKQTDPLARNSPPTHTELVRAVPKFEDGQIIGFEVYQGTDRGAFARLHLRPGDVLLSVDGTVLSDVEILNRSLKSISEGANLIVTIRRDAQELTQSLDGAALISTEQPLANLQSAPPRP